MISLNLTGRTLTTSQRAMIANRLRKMFGAAPVVGTEASPEDRKSATRAAKALKVGRTAVKLAEVVEKEAPDLAAKVDAGEMTVGAAVKEVKSRARAKKDRALSAVEVVEANRSAWIAVEWTEKDSAALAEMIKVVDDVKSKLGDMVARFEKCFTIKVNRPDEVRDILKAHIDASSLKVVRDAVKALASEFGT